MDHNHHINRSYREGDTEKSGQYARRFRRRSNRWDVARLKEKKGYQYVPELLATIFKYREQLTTSLRSIGRKRRAGSSVITPLSPPDTRILYYTSHIPDRHTVASVQGVNYYAYNFHGIAPLNGNRVQHSSRELLRGGGPAFHRSLCTIESEPPPPYSPKRSETTHKGSLLLVSFTKKELYMKTHLLLPTPGTVQVTFVRKVLHFPQIVVFRPINKAIFH